jgi:hypothetical protein
MSLEKWVEYGWLRREPTSPGEIKDLLGIVERSLTDSKVEAVSTDLRFIAAFNAALCVATTALRASGHRTTTQAGHHVKTIESLELTIKASPKVIQRFKTFNNTRKQPPVRFPSVHLGYRGLRSRVQPMLHLFMLHQSRLLRDEMAAVKNGEVGNATHIEARGQFRVTLGIHLDNDRTSRHVRSGSRHFRSGRPARAAPGCPKIDQHWDASLLGDLVEQLGIYFERLGCGTQWNFTNPAASRIRKVVSGDAILTSTCLASSQDGQEHLRPNTPSPT